MVRKKRRLNKKEMAAIEFLKRQQAKVDNEFIDKDEIFFAQTAEHVMEYFGEKSPMYQLIRDFKQNPNKNWQPRQFMMDCIESIEEKGLFKENLFSGKGNFYIVGSFLGTIITTTTIVLAMISAIPTNRQPDIYPEASPIYNSPHDGDDMKHPELPPTDTNKIKAK